MIFALIAVAQDLFATLRYYQQPPFLSKTAILLKFKYQNSEKYCLYLKKKKAQKTPPKTNQGISVKPKILEQRGTNFHSKLSRIFSRF